MIYLSATAGSDYTSITTDQTFAASALTGDMICLTVMINEDLLIEIDETFFVALILMSTGIEIGQSMVTIQDDEGTTNTGQDIMLNKVLE